MKTLAGGLAAPVLVLLLLFAGGDALAGQKRPSLPPAQFGISPPRIELDLKGAPVNRMVTLYNYGKREKTIALDLINVASLKQPRPLAPDEQSLSTWAVINPRRFTVAPGDFQVVRLSIRPRVQLKKGRRYAFLRVRQLVSSVPAIDPATRSALVSIGTSYDVPIIAAIE